MCWCWHSAAVPLKPRWAVLGGTSGQTLLTGPCTRDVPPSQMRQYVINTQGLLPPGQPGHLPGHDGDGAPVPGGLVLERRLGRVSGQHRQ